MTVATLKPSTLKPSTQTASTQTPSTTKPEPAPASLSKGLETAPAAPQDAIALLKADHAAVDHLFTEYQKTGSSLISV